MMHEKLCAASILCLGLFFGCTQQVEQKPETGPSLSVGKDCLQAKAVVSWFLPGERKYLTDQDMVFCVGQGSVQILAQEPQGDIYWKWGKQNFSVSKPETVEPAFWNEPLMLLLYAGFMYGGDLLDPGEASDVVLQLEGRPVEPINLKLGGPDMQAVLYRNLSDKKIDALQVADKSSGKVYMAQCYNRRFYGTDAILVPRSIDLFDITAGIASKKRLVQIDLKQVR